MEEIKERKCILCPEILIPSRELTCGTECARKYNKIGNRIIRLLNKKKKRKCIICEKELNLDSLIYCPDCSETYKVIKNHLLEVREEKKPNPLLFWRK